MRAEALFPRCLRAYLQLSTISNGYTGLAQQIAREHEGYSLTLLHPLLQGIYASIWGDASSTRRTLRAKSAGLKGFCNKVVPGLSTP